MYKVMVVDDEAKIRRNICQILAMKGFKAFEAAGGREAIELFAKDRPDAVLLDLLMPDVGGMEALRQFIGIDASVPVIILTAHGDIRSAVDAIRHGAFDYLSKPPDFEHLVITLDRAIERASLEKKVAQLDHALSASLESTFGISPAMKKIIKQFQPIAASDLTVLVHGETGTGKTYLASVIHSLSNYATGPFVKVSIGSLPDSIVESELFGYEKGAFTGADRIKKGYFETASGGTLFIDDLDNISPFVQGKLLSVIEDRQIFRLGNPTPLPLKLRIIGASNMDILKLVREGRFREDLYFRLSEFSILIPPLRDRVEDIAFFGRKFFSAACSALNRPVTDLSGEMADRLKLYRWPGNLRQLKNLMRKVAVLNMDHPMNQSEMDEIVADTESSRPEALDVAEYLTAVNPATGGNVINISIDLDSAKTSLESITEEILLLTLQRCNNNKSVAAEALKVNRKMFYRRL